jgi:hypothetical protein
MSVHSELLISLQRAFGEGQEATVADNLLGFLAKHSETNHISLQLVRQLTPGAAEGALDRTILRVLQYLSGDSARLLDLKFEIYGLDDQVHDLTDEEAQIALREQIDPLTGDYDPSISKRVGIYFAPIQERLNLISKE